MTADGLLALFMVGLMVAGLGWAVHFIIWGGSREPWSH